MEPLLDPMNDRVIKSVQPPPHRPLTHKLMYPDDGKKRRFFHIIINSKTGSS